MQITWEQNNWFNNNPLQRQLISFVISVIIVVLLLLIPISLTFNFTQQDQKQDRRDYTKVRLKMHISQYSLTILLFSRV